MNRYTVAGVLTDVTAGRRVLVVTADQQASRYALADVVAALEAAGRQGDVRIFRAAGAERVDRLAGGGVVFRSIRQGVHGLSADVLVLEAEPTMDRLAAFLPAIAASSVREVIR